MEEMHKYPMVAISKDDIMRDKTISWVIKYDLLQAHTIFELNTADLSIYDRYSEHIIYFRRYNRENYPNRKYVFCLHTDRIFYTISTIEPQISENNPYDEDSLEYNYGRREEIN